MRPRGCDRKCPSTRRRGCAGKQRGIGRFSLVRSREVATDPEGPSDQHISGGPAYRSIGARDGGAPPWWSAQHRVAYVGSKHFVAGFSEALRADLSGTGVTCDPGMPRSGRERIRSGIRLSGRHGRGAPQFFRISAARCAREALAGFERGEATTDCCTPRSEIRRGRTTPAEGFSIGDHSK
jgi:NAD(P)-dependent dehydrogenase (short-subunit alcohol dehydrogenase family)